MYRLFLIYILLNFLPSMASAERVFAEELLNTWGYETTSLDGERHSVKSIDNKYGEDSEIAYYARFEMWYECLESSADAASKISALAEKRNSSLLQRQKDYQREIQQNECIYYIKTYANATFLDYQASLIENIEEHVSK